MNLNLLKGLTFDRCQLSKSGYSFEFSDTTKGLHKHYKISTSYCVSFSEEELIDVEDKFSFGVWPLLERKVVEISVIREIPKMIIQFDTDGIIVIWPGELPVIDNLVIVEDLVSNQWSPIC